MLFFIYNKLYWKNATKENSKQIAKPVALLSNAMLNLSSYNIQRQSTEVQYRGKMI